MNRAMTYVFLLIACLGIAVLSAIDRDSPFIEMLKELSLEGDAGAQWELGNLYYIGEGTDRNLQEAHKWWLMAAEQGIAKAQYRMGNMYYNGEGVKQDYQEARKWYLLAAKQADAGAQECMGYLYCYGRGVKQDFEEARKWWLLAAEQGYENAQKNMGALYYYGDGVKQDFNEARKWFLRAAEQGHPDAHYYLGALHYNGEGVKQDYKEARKWFLSAAEQGHPDSQYYLGTLYYNGEGVKRNYKEAHKWWLLASEQGNADAQYQLGLLLHRGLGIPKDQEKALFWIKEAASQGHKEAIFYLKPPIHKILRSILYGTGIILAVLLSASLHELAHAYVAYKLGDDSRTILDRLTLNPLKHISWLGSVIVPFVFVLSSSIFLKFPFFFGWAKPVEGSLDYLQKPKRDLGLIALAGPIMNFLIANIFVLVYHLINIGIILELALNLVIINLVLCLFNLIPYPSADGSKVAAMFLPFRINSIKNDIVFGIFTVLFIVLLLIMSSDTGSFLKTLLYPIDFYLRLVGIS